MSTGEVSSKPDSSYTTTQPQKPEQEDFDRDIPAILDRHRGKRAEMIAVLKDIQSRYGYLPEDAMRMVSERTGRPLVDIYGIATFYHLFSLEPRGKHVICACTGTACHVRGAADVVDEFQKQLGIKSGETTPDREFTLETVNCLGACALGPIVVIDGRYFSKMRRRKVRELLDKARDGFEAISSEADDRLFSVSVNCSNCNRSLMDPGVVLDSQPSIRLSALGDGHLGRLRLSSIFGSNLVSAEWEIPERSVVRFFCPHCNEEMLDGTPCPVCDAPLVSLLVDGGGTVQFCARRGCGWHQLDLM